MARIRTIKPEFFTSEDIVSLSPMARLLYIALWCEADREGRLVWKPRTFKLRYLPADDCSVEDLAAELISSGLVVLYSDDEYAYIPSFLRHQHLNPRESASVLPEPSVDSHKKARVMHASPRVSDVQGGKEGKGKEGVNTPPPPTGGAFARFWEAWPKHPRKVARPQCERKWRSTGCDAMADQILTALEAAKRSEDWRKDDGGFIPAPLVWLNQARWEAPTKVELEPVGPDIAEQTRAMLEAKRLTPEEKAASEAARLRVMAAVKRVA